MYLNFYGLQEKPFNETPDPKFLYLSLGHREALAQLVYGVQQRKGFMVVTGDVGTGKTTLLQVLLQRLGGEASAALLFHPMLPFDGILEYMLEEFGIAGAGPSQAQRLLALKNFLVERRRAGQSTLLMLDEAQNLDPSILEQVRLLSNFESSTEKLLQILLVGQPELEAKLRLRELRQLKQRIGLQCRIPPLTRQETRNYIRHRLETAGAVDPEVFSSAAVSRIGEYAGDIPRVINILCDHCLLFGYADRRPRIERDIVEQAIAYLQGKQASGEMPAGTARLRVPRLRWALGSGAVGKVASLVAAYVSDLARSARDFLALR